MAIDELCLPVIVVGAIIVAPMVVRVIYQYERGVMFQFGKYIGMREPGLTIVIPILQDMRKVDIRILTIDIPKQSVMTKDNVPVSVNGVVYFKVVRPEDATIKIQNYEYAMSQMVARFSLSAEACLLIIFFKSSGTSTSWSLMSVTSSPHSLVPSSTVSRILLPIIVRSESTSSSDIAPTTSRSAVCAYWLIAYS